MQQEMPVNQLYDVPGLSMQTVATELDLLTAAASPAPRPGKLTSL